MELSQLLQVALFHFSMALRLKECCRRVALHLGFFSFILWPRVVSSTGRWNKLSGDISSSPWSILYVWIICISDFGVSVSTTYQGRIDLWYKWLLLYTVLFPGDPGVPYLLDSMSYFHTLSGLALELYIVVWAYRYPYIWTNVVLPPNNSIPFVEMCREL